MLVDSTIDRYRLGFHDGWYLIPLYEDGLFLNFQKRRDDPNKRINYWYNSSHPVILNAEILEFVDYIYITEGTVDSLYLIKRAYLVYHNPVVMYIGIQNGMYYLRRFQP